MRLVSVFLDHCVFFSRPFNPLIAVLLMILDSAFADNFVRLLQIIFIYFLGWLGSRVVSVLDSTWVQIAAAMLSGNSLNQTIHTHCASVHQAAKLVAALLRVAGVTADLAESNGSLPSGL